MKYYIFNNLLHIKKLFEIWITSDKKITKICNLNFPNCLMLLWP